MVRISGQYQRTTVAGEEVSAFVPVPLPPKDPPLQLDGKLSASLDQALRSLARLDLAGAMVPSVEKRHREEYYRRLDAVRTSGDWEGWTAFFLEGVDTIATEAVETARKLFALVSADRERVLATSTATVISLRLFELLPSHPIVTVSRAMKLLAASRPAAGKAIEVLESAEILIEITGRKRDRAYGYTGYLDALRSGTED